MLAPESVGRNPHASRVVVYLMQGFKAWRYNVGWGYSLARYLHVV